MSDTTKELMRLWRQFCSWVIEVNPHYVDSDFNFNNFMEWLDGADTENPTPNP